MVHGVGAVGEQRLRGRHVAVGPVWFGRGGGGGRGMVQGGHGGAAGGRHWAGGLHSCRLILLMGTVAHAGRQSDAGVHMLWVKNENTKIFHKRIQEGQRD